MREDKRGGSFRSEQKETKIVPPSPLFSQGVLSFLSSSLSSFSLSLSPFSYERIFYSTALGQHDFRGRLISQSHCIKPEACIKQGARRSSSTGRKDRARLKREPVEKGKKFIGIKRDASRRKDQNLSLLFIPFVIII